MPLEGLTVCEKWDRLPGHMPVKTKVWWGVMHGGILQAPGGLGYVVDEIVGMGRAERRRSIVSRR